MKRIFFIALAFLFSTNIVFAAVTKGFSTLDSWSTIPQNTLVVGSTADVSGNYGSTLAIDVCATSGTAATNGLEVIVQGSSASTGDNNWEDITRFGALSGVTGNQENITNNPAAAGTTVFTVASTTGYANSSPMQQLYIKDSTLANSEIRAISSVSANVSVTVETGSTNAHNLSTPMYNLVITQPVDIPDSVSRVRVIYNNKADAAGSTYDVRSNVLKITGL